ncbi:MAG: hypothetical protein HUJ96_08650 [Marinilabiliaceae bacterium]|nr:hypothetical protein [Marinilabiliaceae bacterium]
MIKIKVKGVEYNAQMTMGTMLQFKRLTGHEAAQIDSTSIEDSITLLYCMVKSWCKREDKEFGLSLEDFADGLTPEDFSAAVSSLGETPTTKKKH